METRPYARPDVPFHIRQAWKPACRRPDVPRPSGGLMIEIKVRKLEVRDSRLFIADHHHCILDEVERMQ